MGTAIGSCSGGVRFHRDVEWWTTKSARTTIPPRIVGIWPGTVGRFDQYATNVRNRHQQELSLPPAGYALVGTIGPPAPRAQDHVPASRLVVRGVGGPASLPRPHGMRRKERPAKERRRGQSSTRWFPRAADGIHHAGRGRWETGCRDYGDSTTGRKLEAGRPTGWRSFNGIRPGPTT